MYLKKNVYLLIRHTKAGGNFLWQLDLNVLWNILSRKPCSSLLWDQHYYRSVRGQESQIPGVSGSPRPLLRSMICYENSQDSASNRIYGWDLLWQKHTKQNQERERRMGENLEEIRHRLLKFVSPSGVKKDALSSSSNELWRHMWNLFYMEAFCQGSLLKTHCFYEVSMIIVRLIETESRTVITRGWG